MSRSLYSLILSDEVISEIDRLAYKMNTNRSNMVNQILAEYISYETPEKRMQKIFKCVEDALSVGDTFQMLMGQSDSTMSLRSAIAYKYNPTVRYSVELYRGGSPSFGELKVYLRTQNSALVLCMMQFYKLWVKVEEEYIDGAEYSIDDEKFTRKLVLRKKHENISTSSVGELIANYINTFDKALKAFFYNIDNPKTAAAEVSTVYRDYIRSSDEII